jgi:hypothetical protein
MIGKRRVCENQVHGQNIACESSNFVIAQSFQHWELHHGFQLTPWHSAICDCVAQYCKDLRISTSMMRDLSAPESDTEFMDIPFPSLDFGFSVIFSGQHTPQGMWFHDNQFRLPRWHTQKQALPQPSVITVWIKEAGVLA